MNAMIKISVLCLLLAVVSRANSEIGVPIVVDSNGSAIGYWQRTQGGGDELVVLSNKNVFFVVDHSTGQVIANSENYYACTIDDEPLYSTVDCSGVARYKTVSPVGYRCGGILKRMNAPPNILIFTPFAALAEETIVRSRRLFSGTCSPYPGPQIFNTVEAGANDPAISGVLNVPYLAPISVTLTSAGNCLFRDGFEICQ